VLADRLIEVLSNQRGVEMGLMMSFKNRLLGAAAIAAAVSFGTSAFAVTYQTPVGANSAKDGPVSAQATFDLSGNNLLVTITDLLVNPTSDGQMISGIRFDESGATGSGALTSVNSGLISTVNTSTGTFTAGASDPLTRWHATESGTTITLTTLTGGKPDRLIIGPPDGSNLYSNANPSTKNPVVLNSAIFTIAIPGVTSLSSILDDVSNVYIMFGTSNDPFDLVLTSCIDCRDDAPPPGATPLPAALPLFASGGALLGFLGWRRKRKSAA
jgi:hypothetical protein